MRKGDHLWYWSAYDHGDKIAAVVCRAHRDGTATIEARFCLDANGEPTGTYFGYKFRLPQTDLHVLAEMSQ